MAALAPRAVALGGLALLAGAAALAVAAQRHDSQPAGPRPVGSFAALAGSSGPQVFGRRSACGGVVTAQTEGIAHPTLPCGARVFITFDGTTVLTAVVDHGPLAPGRQIDLTDALARRLGLSGVQTVHWSYAQSG